jgi:hypothetical protein
VQPERRGRARQDRLHQGARLFGEVLPVADGEPGRLDGGAQPQGRDEVASVRPVGPRHRVVELPWRSGGDVPDGEAPARDQDPAGLRVQAYLVGHVHLDVLAGHHVEGGVGVRQVSDVALPDADLAVEARDLVEPAGRLAVLRGQVHRAHLAAVCGGEEPGGPADAGARVEHAILAGDPGELGQLAGGDAAQRVEVLERAEVRGCQVVRVLARGDEGLLDALPGQARRVLGADLAGCHGVPFRSRALPGRRPPG